MDVAGRSYTNKFLVFFGVSQLLIRSERLRVALSVDFHCNRLLQVEPFTLDIKLSTR